MTLIKGRWIFSAQGVPSQHQQGPNALPPQREDIVDGIVQLDGCTPELILLHVLLKEALELV